jgi:hypothetical protein
VAEGATREQGRGVGGTKKRTAAWMAWSVWALCVVLFASAELLDFFNSSVPTRGGPFSNLYIAIALLAYPTVGAIVASHRPNNLVGWILCAIGLLFGVGAFAEAYPYYALAAVSGSLPGGVYMAWFSAKSLWLLGLFLGSALLVLLFPNGRLLSRSWRAVVWLAVGGSAISAFAHATSPGRMAPYGISNPFGIERNPRSILELLGDLGAATLLVCCVLAVISVFVRLQSAEGEERQQIKWFAYAAAVLLSTFFLGLPLAAVMAALGLGWVAPIPLVIGVLAIPAAVGVAMLRYRLYDIDVIINRTLVYGLLTATLVAVYLVCVLLLHVVAVVPLQYIFHAFTGETSTIPVVISTLAMATLFNPLRRRIQGFIDKRFYRRKYDARKTLEAFSAQLRNETDLEALGDDLVGVVRETMQPAHVSLWLRPEAASRSEQTD